jgi:hypothetical protein
MTFKALVLRDVRPLAAALRAKLCRAPAGFFPVRAAFVTPAPQDPQRPMVSSLGRYVSARAA